MAIRAPDGANKENASKLFFFILDFGKKITSLWVFWRLQTRVCSYIGPHWVKCVTKFSMVKRHWQLILSELGFYFSSGVTLDIDVIFLWRTFYWSIEDKTYKEIPSKHFLENLPKKARTYAFIHLKLIGNLQAFN